jgi:predicted RNA-binding Zn-ribbon protein involved in translation (DUF1610 family)
MSPREERRNRWNDRRALAAVLGLVIFLVPIACSIGTVLLAEHFIAEPTTAVGFGLWWVGVLLAATLVFLGSERVARRALPLAILLKMGLLFPSQAPKRLAVARRAASTRHLHRRIEEARELGRDDQPTAAAERIVALAASLSAHDQMTRGHSERVRAYTDLIAAELHLARADRDRLRWSALLHDIGKLAAGGPPGARDNGAMTKHRPQTHDFSRGSRAVRGEAPTFPVSVTGGWKSETVGYRSSNKSMLRRRLSDKAATCGVTVVAVNPAHTSQRCAACGHTSPDNRKNQAEFRCRSCGHEANADVNAAVNILAAGLAVTARGGTSRGKGPGEARTRPVAA